MNDRLSSARARPRWLHLHPVLFGLCALLWIVLRSGRKPARLLYPCQRAALGAATLTLGLPVAGAVAGASAAVRTRKGVAAALATALAVGMGGLALSGHIPATTGRVMSVASFIPGMAGGAAPATPNAETISTIYVVEQAAGPQGTHHGGLDALIGCMGGGGLKFYRSPTAGPESGPDGIVGAGDLVLIKINQQWSERGGTNTDVLKGLIARIIEHPDGFTGEVVVIENTQGMGTLDWPNSNAEDHSQSAPPAQGRRPGPRSGRPLGKSREELAPDGRHETLERGRLRLSCTPRETCEQRAPERRAQLELHSPAGRSPVAEVPPVTARGVAAAVLDRESGGGEPPRHAERQLLVETADLQLLARPLAAMDGDRGRGVQKQLDTDRVIEANARQVESRIARRPETFEAVEGEHVARHRRGDLRGARLDAAPMRGDDRERRAALVEPAPEVASFGFVLSQLGEVPVLVAAGAIHPHQNPPAAPR